MKDRQRVYTLLFGLMVLPALAYNREPSIQKDIDINANINITLPVAPGLYIEVPQRSTSLVWNDSLRRFNDFYFQFDVWLDATTSSSLSRSTVMVSMMDVNMRCQTRTDSYAFAGLRDDPRNTGTPHYTATIQIPGSSFPNEWRRVNSTVDIPGSLFQSQNYNPDTQRELPYLRGYIRFTPPDMTQIKADGGASCLGGALLMFSSISV
ncbi:hypothetical protein [Morganella psychrotolerans]|uniref:hypothetical protein n=1 Tax=Morganella psychrotolerans TaxID=368603 RepID=UPI0039B0E132